MTESQISSELARSSALYKHPDSFTASELDENISSPDGQAPVGSSHSEEEPVNADTPPTPNNNSCIDRSDCINDSNCTTNTIIDPAESNKKINLASDFKFEKKLIVKLETPTFSSKLNSQANSNKEDTDNSDEPKEKSDVSNNGVIKSKGKNRKEAVKSGAGQKRSSAGRGRPPKKPAIATYHSQISGDKNTIKIRIRKSHLGAQVSTPVVKRSRQRRKQKRVEQSDTDASDYEGAGKRPRSGDTSSTREAASVSSTSSPTPESTDPQEQSVWGRDLPEVFLQRVFEQLCLEQGSLPLLVTLGKLCKLWNSVAIKPELWKDVDLSTCVKDRAKTDIRLQWLIHNRLKACHDLNLSDWKIQNIQLILEQLCDNCPELRGLNLSGWSGLTAENLKYLTTESSKLERIDLSAVNLTNQGTKSALNAAPLMSLAQTMGSRLTHLILAHNKLAGLAQILNSISAHCPNLQLLDLSNIKTHAYNSSLLHVEKLQIGCPKLRVLRVTNSQISLAPTSLTEQMASPGFPELEELSLAGTEDGQTTSKFIDDNGIERILKCSHRLRLLDVRGCTKITDSGLVKVPAWDLEHLFLSACYVTRLNHSGLELILQKWSHSLVEVDLAWSTATDPLDAAVMTLAEKGSESPLRTLDLCGSSVSMESVKAVLMRCPHIQSINLQSCRALPRGIKRLYEGPAVAELCAALHGKPERADKEEETSEPPEQPVEDESPSADM